MQIIFFMGQIYLQNVELCPVQVQHHDQHLRRNDQHGQKRNCLEVHWKH